jgi:hypothetical protein
MKHRSTLWASIIIVWIVSMFAAQTVNAQTSSSTLSGVWQGTGTSIDGRSFKLTFDIKNGMLTGLLYSFNGTDGITCSAISYAQIPLADQAEIVDNKLTAVFGSDVVLSTVFSDDDTASGHLTVHWHDRQPRCNGDYELDWTATKQAAQPPAIPTPSRPVNAHPFQTFFQILIFGLSNGSVLALNAIGVTLIYSTVRTLNLAHGDVFALASALVTSLVNILGITQKWHPLQLAGALLRMGVEQLGFKPFHGHSHLAPLIGLR